MIIKGNRNSNNKLYSKLNRLYFHMKDRCYKEKHHAYKNYGMKGVKVSEEWSTLSKFIDTVDKVDGWDIDKFMNGELTLDKDSIDRNNLLYSIDTCKFISKEENNKIKPNQQRLTIGISPNNEYYEFYNQSEFARIHNLRQSTISDCLKGRVKAHRGWKFKYK